LIYTKVILKKIVSGYMEKVPEVKVFADRCLRTERWNGNIILMVVDAAFNSIGLSYFHSVIPKVEAFRKQYIEQNKIKSLKSLTATGTEEFETLWKNKRSWHIGISIAAYLSELGLARNLNDTEALRLWAKESSFPDWTADPIGRINGVGINTYQYLRMMGGIDTVMPDKIVKRIINKIFNESGMNDINADVEFIKTVEEIAPECGYRPIELCWMTWLIQSENDLIHMEKHSEILSKI
jgi:hypothetical protein